MAVDYPYAPVMSNNPFINTLDYDNLINSINDDIPTNLQGKEELLPNYLTNIY